MSETATATAQEKGGEEHRRWLTIEEAAAYTSLSPSWLRRLAQEGRVKSYKPAGGRRVLFDRDELDHWILASRT